MGADGPLKSKEREDQRHIHSEDWRREQVILFNARKAATAGDLSGIISVVRTATGPEQERLAASIVNTMVNCIGEPGVGTLDSYVKTAINERNIGPNTAKELVIVSLVVLGASFKERMGAIFPEELKRIQDNTEMPPEIRAMAGMVKDTDAYGRYLHVEELFNKIKQEKLAGANQKSHSFRGV